MMAPLKRWADHVIDTTDSDANALRQQIRNRFGGEEGAPILAIQSFGYRPRPAAQRRPRLRHALPAESRTGCRRCAPLTGLEQAVADYIAADPAYEDAVARIEELLLALLPRYQAEGKILCLGRLRLYRRATPLGPCRRAGRRTVARGGIFAHVWTIATSPRRRATASSAPAGAKRRAFKVNR